jgi:hypothetical protein
MFAQILASGLLLATVLALVSLNLLLVEGASEVYHNATLFAQAIAKGAGFGEGDFTTLQIVKNALAKMSSYYFGLAAALTIFGFALPSVVPLLLSSLASMIDLLFRIGWGFGFPPVVTPLFWTIIMLGATVLIRAFKNRFSHSVFSYPS